MGSVFLMTKISENPVASPRSETGPLPFAGEQEVTSAKVILPCGRGGVEVPHRSAALGRLARLRWRARPVGIAGARESRPVSLHASAHRAIGVGPRRLRLGVERGENVKDVGRVIGAGESSPAEEVGKTLNIKTPFGCFGPALRCGALHWCHQRVEQLRYLRIPAIE